MIKDTFCNQHIWGRRQLHATKARIATIHAKQNEQRAKVERLYLAVA